MVEHKVRVFYEPDDNAIGAEVKIYSEAGDEIDNILITTESKWRELDDKINNMDSNFIDREELLETIRNVSDDLVQINATTLAGVSVDQLAKANHNESHVNYFAPISHALETSRYGLGSSSQYGHVKVLDNLESSSFQNGEALSAHQGYELNNLITSLRNELTKWESITVPLGNLRVCKALRLAQYTFYKASVSLTANEEKYLNDDKRVIPEEYKPPTFLRELAHPHIANPTFAVIEPDTGKIYAKSTATATRSINAQFFWRY